MQTDVINIGLSFLEGFALIISPCILPILPIILASSLGGSKKRPLGIVTGFVLAFALFTFFSRKLVQYSGVDLAVIRHISYALLFLLGLVMVSSSLSNQFARFTQRLANVGLTLSANKNADEGFVSGVLLGVLVGLIWTPCAGPILAAVIVQTVIQTTTWTSFLIVLAFGLGAAVPMLIIILFGRGIMAKLSVFKHHTELFRQIMGGIIMASVLYMVYAENTQLSFANTSNTSITGKKLIDGVLMPYAAPQIAGITDWINSPPLTLTQLKGKVVLIDFWTYSCINCLRTLPYLKEWYQKYHALGLEIIGVHSPEFDFEKNLANVKNAVLNAGIHYPVALDNQFVTWRNFENGYWPAHYLLDKNGQVVYTHFGEGAYAITENNIRFLLGIQTAAPMTRAQEKAFYPSLSPETYFGYFRMTHFASPETMLANKAQTYSFPENLAQNAWALKGSWVIGPQWITAKSAGAILKFHFDARKVFIVMGSATGFSIPVKLILNGEPVNLEKGKDVKNSMITVNGNRLYDAISLPQPGSGILQVVAMAPGLEIYTFTFEG